MYFSPLMHLQANHVKTDSAVFRLHTNATVILLVTFSIAVTTRQYVGNPIDCVHTRWVEGTVENKMENGKSMDCVFAESKWAHSAELCAQIFRFPGWFISCSLRHKNFALKFFSILILCLFLLFSLIIRLMKIVAAAMTRETKTKILKWTETFRRTS